MPVIPPPSPIDWDEIMRSARTGDLFLFAGNSFVSTVIEDFTSGPFSHSAMVVRESPTTAPWLWQANDTRLANDPQKGYPDTHRAITPAKDGAGAQLGWLDEALNTISQAGDDAFYRPLVGAPPKQFAGKVGHVIDMTKGKPFPSVPGGLAEHYAEGLLGINSGADNFFCSQLVAYTYQQAGLLSDSWPPNSYAPNDFDTENTPALLKGSLGPIRHLRIETVPGHGEPPVSS